MQDALTTFFSQFEPVPWLCYLFPVLALGILIRCAVSLLTFRPEPEVWAWLTTPDGAHIPVTHWESLIGRGAGCDVQLGYPTAAGRSRTRTPNPAYLSTESRRLSLRCASATSLRWAA